MSIRGIYFSQIKDEDHTCGAAKKVLDQIAAFEDQGYEMRFVNFRPASEGMRKTFIGKGLCASLPFTYVFSKYEYSHDYDGYDFYYFRFEAADYPFSRFLKLLRDNNKKSKIIIEFPDFPNTYWMNSVLHLPLLVKDYIARKLYKKYVDRFTVLNSKYDEIYGVKTLHYMNGIDVKKIPKRLNKDLDPNRIEIIGVCTMFPVHGYDRFIKGMVEYYKTERKRKVILHLVGDGPGPELKNYMDLVKKNKIEEYVIFEGALSGDKLTDCFNMCDLALDKFGAYRINLAVNSSLKSREYFARGIPIITGCEIDVLDGKDYEYIMEYPNDDSIIDINKTVEFFDSVYYKKSCQDVIDEIRMFAENNCTYDATMKSVFDYIHS